MWVYLCLLYIVVGYRFLHWYTQLWLHPYRITESTHQHMKQTLLIIRHGQTVWNVEHRLPGQVPGVMLTETGREQAARLADALTVLPISMIVSSPLERAYATAEYIAKGRTVQIQQDADLMDTNIGSWTGQVIDDLAKNDATWTAYVKNPTVAPESVETFPEVQRRSVAAVERWLAREDSGAYPAFVAHADVVKLLIAHYSGLDAARAGSLMIENASVSLVELEQQQLPRVIAIGWSPRPGWLKVPGVEDARHADPEQEV